METHGDHDRHALTHERAILKEWDYLQQSLFNFVPTALRAPHSTRRQIFEHHITYITETKACIWWEVYRTETHAVDSRIFEMCYQQIRYGLLELSNGYLESTFVPGLPQHFANLCALLLYTAEHEQFIHYQLAQFPQSVGNRSRKSLTTRQKDVLFGLMRGESEKEMALRLGITEATIHTHIQRLYMTLNVDSGQQAIFRAFELRFVDWLDMSERE